MKPIPKTLLIHSAELFEEKEGGWQEPAREKIAELSRIRIEPCSRLVQTDSNRSVTLEATLFYDCRNSSPANVEFKQGQRLTFGGELYKIELVEPLYDNKRLHHLEVGLCR